MRFACLGHDLGKGTTPADVLPRHIGHEERSVKLVRALCERLRVPVDCRELAEVVAREHGNVHRSARVRRRRAGAPAGALRRAAPAGAFRRDAAGLRMRRARPRRQGRASPTRSARAWPPRCVRPLSVDTAPVAEAAAARGLSGAAIGEAVREARVRAIADALSTS